MKKKRTTRSDFAPHTEGHAGRKYHVALLWSWLIIGPVLLAACGFTTTGMRMRPPEMSISMNPGNLNDSAAPRINEQDQRGIQKNSTLWQRMRDLSWAFGQPSL